MANRPPPPRTGSRAWYLLLLLPFIGLLWPPFYAKEHPRLAGFPFFYWYQFLWVLLVAGITALVYLLTTPRASRTPGNSSGKSTPSPAADESPSMANSNGSASAGSSARGTGPVPSGRWMPSARRGSTVGVPITRRA